MNSKFSIRIISQIILVLVPFLFLVNSINYLTSNLNRQNKILNSQKETLTTRIERKKAQVGSDLTTVIEDRLKTGAIESVTPSGTISVLQLQPKVNDIIPAPNNNTSSTPISNPSGVIIR